MAFTHTDAFVKALQDEAEKQGFKGEVTVGEAQTLAERLFVEALVDPKERRAV